jgi:hypothetical protein
VARRNSRPTWPAFWRSDEEIVATLALGRQVLTVMAVALLVAAGFILDREALGFLLGWHAFCWGAWWVDSVHSPDDFGLLPPGGGGVGPRPPDGGAGPWHPTPPVPGRGVDSWRDAATWSARELS